MTPGQYVWVGIRSSYATTQPQFPNLFGENGGTLQQTANSATITNGTPYSATQIAAGRTMAPDILLSIG